MPVPDPPKPIHLVLLMHGLWGNHQNLAFLESKLVDRFGSHLEVINFAGNDGNRTYDGVDGCGERIADIIIERLENKEKPPVKELSFIGYSLGGLMIRYAAGLLFAKGVFDSEGTGPKVVPKCFITIATPHAGAARKVDSAAGRFFNLGASFFTSRSGAHLMLRDRDGDDISLGGVVGSNGEADKHTYPAHGGCSGKKQTGKPLVDIMADPRFPFWQALNKFQYRTAFANTINDKLVNFTTSSIEASNLYRKEGAKWEVADKKYPSIVRLVPEPGVKQDEVGKGEGDAVLEQEGEVAAELVDLAAGNLGEKVAEGVMEQVGGGVEDWKGQDATSEKDPSSTTPSSSHRQSSATTKSTAFTNRPPLPFILMLPILIPIGLTVLTSFLTKATFRHYWEGASEAKKKRDAILSAATIKSLPSNSISTEDLTPDSKADSPLFTSPSTATIPDAFTVRRRNMIHNLNKLEWRKVHVRIHHPRSHAVIAGRFPGGEDIIEFLVDKVFVI
ncbi:hypothetical protein HK097_006888 [Rhizophlyctis rosea]|uniref:DUF676 domain-containing protein n=1 Tax=Rhizophlyctis rosea TaxID=64517 RepID=A0AAD5SCC8_9FUNG|nr:hypothetical protein HK097_006888 [Rhizophlyctis rosea]